MGWAGRPKLSGRREANGRLQRQTPKCGPVFWARAEWIDYCNAVVPLSHPFGVANHAQFPLHPLLRLVEAGKFDAEWFRVALYWMATSHNTNPNWSGRKYLSDATGLDFHSMQGCKAARQLAVDTVGREPVKLLDRATLGCDVAVLDLSPIEETVKQVWRAWCEHGAGKSQRAC